MPLGRIRSGDPARTSKLYLGIGALSLLKAIAVRGDEDRFRRELVDAGLFLAVGLALRQYSQLKAEKRAELESQLPDWLVTLAGSNAAKQGVRTIAKQRLTSDPDPEPSIRKRARGLVSRFAVRTVPV